MASSMFPSKAAWAINSLIVAGVLCVLLQRSDLILMFMCGLAVCYTIGVAIYLASRAYKHRKRRQPRGFEVVFRDKQRD